MPDIDGLEVCRRLRTDPAYAPTDGEPAPRVLMLTARDALDDRVAGLDDGADDYLVKPFAFAELSARVRIAAAPRRRPHRRRCSRSASSCSTRPAHEASRGGRLLDLTAKEFALLRYFMAHAGEVLSQEHLLEHVWDEHADPFTNTVRVTVGTLRRKLIAATTRRRSIETVIGSGYRLVDGSVSVAGADAGRRSPRDRSDR